METIRTTVLPAALYGAEVAHCPTVELKALRTAIANTVGPHSARRSVPILLELCGGHHDIDPQVCLFTRKVTLLRRVLAQFPSTAVKVRALLCAYGTQARPGTPQGHYHVHPHPPRKLGPISHLLAEVHQLGATLSPELTLSQPGEAPLPLQHIPWQYVKPLT